MTRIKCRQSLCANWDTGTCGAEEVDLDEDGICLTQDEEICESVDGLSPVRVSWMRTPSVALTFDLDDVDADDEDWEDDDLSCSAAEPDDAEDWDDVAWAEDDEMRPE